MPLPALETLEFAHVSFQHQTASTPALTDISFDVRRGETIAFVGPSGAGKTTLVKLLVGLVSAADGRHPLQRPLGMTIDLEPAARAHRVRDAGHAALLRHHPREPAVRESVGD
ncbi:MAG: ATP-binding cassette domain-containing protein [Vicinamibacterales bacterium]